MELMKLAGLPKEEAIEKLELEGWKWRIISEDGNSFVVTRDYRMDRINLVIENGLVKNARIG